MENPQRILLQTFVSTHFTVEIETGEFVSPFGTPPERKAIADECENTGCRRVLARGTPTDRQTVLVSPIILYDYPRITPEERIF